MAPATLPGRLNRTQVSDRPIAFLVSTTGCARVIKGTLGSAAYSYAFVLEGLAPALEALGKWQLVDHPESSLAYQAMKAEQEGYRPVHLALHPPQDAYLSPVVPNILFPFWEFPHLPDREFGFDTRQNWVRISNRADLIIAACEFTAKAFREANIKAPVAVVTVPLKSFYFDIPAWDPKHSWTHTCRHHVWGEPLRPDDDGPTEVSVVRDEPAAEPEPPAPEPRPGLKRRAYETGRKGFRKVLPYLPPKMRVKVTRAKHLALKIAGRDPLLRPTPEGPLGPGKIAFFAARRVYRRSIKPWLSHEAIVRIRDTKLRFYRLVGKRPPDQPINLLPTHDLTLKGIVFTSIFNLGDRRKNEQDLLSAFLMAFKDRPDVTLVIKLATNPQREPIEVPILAHMYHSLGIQHRCRVVVITSFLTDEQMAELTRVTTFYVNMSKAEGACLPLQQSLAAGRPSIAPDHTAMADFMDDKVGFVIRSHPEPTYWPHDPEKRTETYWQRIVWSDLRDHLIAAADLAENDPDRYQEMARTARERLREYAGPESSLEALREAVRQLPDVETGRFSWAS